MFICKQMLSKRLWDKKQPNNNNSNKTAIKNEILNTIKTILKYKENFEISFKYFNNILNICEWIYVL